MHEPGDRPGDLPAGPGLDLQTRLAPVPEAAPVPHRLSQRTGAAADTAAPSRAGATAAEADADGALPGSGDDQSPERRTGLGTGPGAPTGEERLRQEAFETAWRFLAHRERTEAELTARLE